MLITFAEVYFNNVKILHIYGLFYASCIDASFIDVAINSSTNSIKYYEFLSINRMSCIIRQEFVYLYSVICRSFEHYCLALST